jgi:hypothetical protein
MQLTLDVGVADLAATRFAVSPLSETVLAVLLLGNPGWSTVNQPRVRWARAELGTTPIRLPAGGCCNSASDLGLTLLSAPARALFSR